MLNFCLQCIYALGGGDLLLLEYENDKRQPDCDAAEPIRVDMVCTLHYDTGKVSQRHSLRNLLDKSKHEIELVRLSYHGIKVVHPTFPNHLTFRIPLGAVKERQRPCR